MTQTEAPAVVELRTAPRDADAAARRSLLHRPLRTGMMGRIVKRITVAVLLLVLPSVAACRGDGPPPAASQPLSPNAERDAEPEPIPSDEVQAARAKGEDQYIEDETLAANAELLECLQDAGKDKGKLAACEAAFSARLRRILEVVKRAEQTTEERAPR